MPGQAYNIKLHSFVFSTSHAIRNNLRQKINSYLDLYTHGQNPKYNMYLSLLFLSLTLFCQNSSTPFCYNITTFMIQVTSVYQRIYFFFNLDMKDSGIGIILYNHTSIIFMLRIDIIHLFYKTTSLSVTRTPHSTMKLPNSMDIS